jgi:hypothetical protein
MIDSTAAYRYAISEATRRKMYILAIVNIISPEITYGTVSADSQSAYSKPAALHDKVFDTPKRYATGEPGRWPLDGTVDILPDAAADLTGGCFLGGKISGADGAFSTPVWVEMAFSNVSILQACSVWFSDDPLDGVPADFTVEVKQGGTVYYAKTFTGNTEAGVSMDGFTVNNPDTIRVTVTKWSIPYRRFRAVEIVPGIYERWTAGDICELSINQEVNFSCLSIPYGTATLKMNNISRRFEPRKKSGLFQSIEEGQEIPISLGVRLADGAVEYKPVGVYYQHNGGWRTGNNDLSIQWSLVDIVGLLADRDFVVPATLPTTLSGWLACLVSQLGSSFTAKYHVDPNYAGAAVTVSTAADVTGKKCGEILRYACMAAGVFPRADAETGYLTAEPLWNAGGYISLSNLVNYPTMKANDTVSALIFKLYDGTENGTTYTVSGSNTAAQPLSIDNPFIHSQAQALAAARCILTMYGGNQIEISGRGDPASELGDVDSVQLDKSQATSARRFKQAFNFSGGVMKDLPSTLLQANGYRLFKNREIITADGTWTAPDGVTVLRVILVSGGNGGGNGTDGTWDTDGVAGTDGTGGKVYSSEININSGQTFPVKIGAGGAAGGGNGEATTMGAYSSAAGSLYDGFTDINDGSVFARDAVELPKASSGDGGRGGTAGAKGNRHEETVTVKDYTCDGTITTGQTDVYITKEEQQTIVDNNPTPGTAGAAGGSGCVIIYYDKAVTA